MEQELIENYEQHIEFTLGYAGTGKSTLLAKQAGRQTIVLTPTHKAKEVLQGKGLENVFTIHSVLKLVPTIDQNFRKKGNLQKLKRIGGVDLSEITRIIIDEFSMIPTHILDLLLTLLPAHARVSIFGDPYQLPPVDGDKIDPYWYTDEGNIRTLTTQYRSDAPEVVETFTRFVKFLESGDGQADLRLHPLIIEGDIDGFDPVTDRALAFTNLKVIEVNNRIAKSLDLPIEISVGEKVSINGLLGILTTEDEWLKERDLGDEGRLLTIYPKCVSKGKLKSGSSLESAIDEVEREMRKFNQEIIDGETHYIEIEEAVYRFYGDINHYHHSKGYKADVEDSQMELINTFGIPEDVPIKSWCKEHRSEPLVRARGKAWSTYLGHQGLVWDLRRPFCTTIHKSQGSEFDTVYIAQDDIKKAIRGGNYEQYARLMYVALSRAIRKVVII